MVYSCLGCADSCSTSHNIGYVNHNGTNALELLPDDGGLTMFLTLHYD